MADIYLNKVVISYNVVNNVMFLLQENKLFILIGKRVKAYFILLVIDFCIIW